jgi:hypothetical protein
MLVSLNFKFKNVERPVVFNPENVLYIDDTGVLFDKDVHRLFAQGEFARFVEMMHNLDVEDILVGRDTPT